jgi:hypothetical protein
MKRPSRPGSAALAAVLLILGAACQDAITDTSAIGDDTLDTSDALGPLVNGMGRALSRAINLTAFTGAAIAREITASGTFVVYGVSRLQREGILDPVETDEHWQAAHQARWVAEDGVRRMRVLLGDGFSADPVAARALLHVGFANRLLGESMCQAVIDGGPAAPRTVHFQRAESAFAEAFDIARRIGDAQLANAALAGRASARVGLGDWTGARTDAASVPTDFRYDALYSAIEMDQYNRIFWATANQPYRNLSVWDTYYAQYYLDTGDERVAWAVDPEYPEGDSGVPWYIQLKYRSRDAPIALATGREMRLLMAEADLRAGDRAAAIAALDAIRSTAGVPPREIATTEEAWTALKRERGIELWLEGRRLGDLRRWIDDETPGIADDMTGRSLCFPIGRTEIVTNPNLP